jgi:hypothetical protein
MEKGKSLVCDTSVSLIHYIGGKSIVVHYLDTKLKGHIQKVVLKTASGEKNFGLKHPTPKQTQTNFISH